MGYFNYAHPYVSCYEFIDSLSELHGEARSKDDYYSYLYE